MHQVKMKFKGKKEFYVFVDDENYSRILAIKAGINAGLYYKDMTANEVWQLIDSKIDQIVINHNSIEFDQI